MKLIGNLLMTVTLLVGLLAAATSYLASVDAPESAWQAGADEYKRTNNESGARTATEEEITALRTQYENGEITAQEMLAQSEALTPVVDADQPLTPEAIETLRESELTVDGESRKVAFVNVKSFSLFGWPYWWAFGLSAVGLFTGSMMVRTATKKEIAAHANDEGGSSHDSPAGLLAQIRMGIDMLRADLEKLTSESDRTHLIVEKIGDMQKKQLADFVDARPKLIATMGLGGYAELMDRFAAAERQINRAWSIAADGFDVQAMECLENAAHLLVETQEKMGV